MSDVDLGGVGDEEASNLDSDEQSDTPTIEEVPLDDLNWEDGKYQNMNDLSDEKYEHVRSKIESEGFDRAHPLIIDEDGIVIDGHHRCEIADELDDVTEVWVAQHSNLSEDLGSARLSRNAV
jgi:hypothetical protein